MINEDSESVESLNKGKEISTFESNTSKELAPKVK